MNYLIQNQENFEKEFNEKANHLESLVQSLLISGDNEIPENERNANLKGEIVKEIKDITVIYHNELSKHSIDMLKIQDSPTPHHYKNIKSLGDYTTKAKRLMSEIKQMSNFLPTYYTNSIFVRYDENHMNLMKSVIMGADDTPYAHGVFYMIFHLSLIILKNLQK